MSKPLDGISYPAEWKTIVIKADPKWPTDSIHPPAYEFSNGRKLVDTIRPGEQYAWLST